MNYLSELHVFFIDFSSWVISRFLLNITSNVEQMKKAHEKQCLKDTLRNWGEKELKKAEPTFRSYEDFVYTIALVYPLVKNSSWIKVVQKCYLTYLYQKNKTNFSLFTKSIYSVMQLAEARVNYLLSNIRITWQLTSGLNWTFWNGDQTTQ